MTKGEARVGPFNGCVESNRFHACEACGRLQKHHEPQGFAHYPNDDIYDRFMCGTFSRSTEKCQLCRLCVAEGDHTNHG